jgi:hypothetical protein
VSLTFSDRGTSTSARFFRRGLVATLVVLGMVVIAAGATTMAQGPQLRQATIDEQSAVRSAPVLTMRSDRAVAPVPPGSITVTPEASFQVEQGDVDLRIIFDHPLLAGTNYRVDVAQVAPKGLGARATWTTSFQTPTEELFFLRASGADTELVRLVPGAASPDVIHRAPGIVGFSKVGVVFAIHREWESQSILELVDPVSGAVDRIALSPDDVITGIASASWGTSLVVTLDTRVNGQVEKGVLALLDTVGSRTPEVVRGIGDEPLRVLKVSVSPVTGNVVVWLRDKTLLVFEPLTGVVIPLGDSAEFWGFDASGTDAVFVDSLGTIAVDVRSRDEIRIPAGQLEGFLVFHEQTTLSPRGVSYQRVMVPGVGDGPNFTVVTEAGDDGIHRRLVGSLTTPESIGSLQLSPNGQYLALELNPTAHPLGYPGLSDEVIRSGTVVVVLDVLTNTVVSTTPGYSFAW